MEEDYRLAQKITDDKIPKAIEKELALFGRIAKRCENLVSKKSIILQEPELSYNELRIATISLDIRKDRDLEPYPKLLKGVNYELHNLIPSAYDRISKTLLDNIEEAAKRNAHFICANELAYPWCNPNHRAYTARRVGLRKKLKNIANEKDTYILAGTYHCTKTYHNYGALFYPGEYGDRNPHLHAKKTSAHSIGEVIRIPYNRDIRFYRTKYGKIGILICLDSYDPSLVIGLVRAKQLLKASDHNIDIVFVPSFNPSIESAHEACQDLSYLLANIVVLVNTHKFGGRYFTVYNCGDIVDDNGDVDEINPNLKIYEINKMLLREKALDIEGARSTTFHAVFGTRKTIRRNL